MELEKMMCNKCYKGCIFEITGLPKGVKITKIKIDCPIHEFSELSKDFHDHHVPTQRLNYSDDEETDHEQR